MGDARERTIGDINSVSLAALAKSGMQIIRVHRGNPGVVEYSC